MSSERTRLGGNPAFKVYDVDPDTYEIMDSRVFVSEYSADVTSANGNEMCFAGDLDDPIYQQARQYLSSHIIK